MAKKKKSMHEYSREQGIDTSVPPELQGQTSVRIRGSKLPPTPPYKRKG